MDLVMVWLIIVVLLPLMLLLMALRIVAMLYNSCGIPSGCSTIVTSVASWKSDLRLYFAKNGKVKVVDISSGEDDDKDGDKNSDDGSLFDDEEALEEEEKKRTRGTLNAPITIS
ncbi:hypothetical protein J3E72DRAFT_264968 [Bipolaris maydis]|nr:hypothetical protein J3E72DRAFT_264968 [Bipolaris maydis]